MPQGFKFFLIEFGHLQQLFRKAVELIFLHTGNLRQLLQLGITGKFQAIGNFFPDLPCVAR